MASSSPPELRPSKNDFNRVYSAETDDSPFGSSLVTPIDEEAYTNQGIHERLDAAETILGYFGSEKIISQVNESTHKLIHQTGDGAKIRQSEQREIVEVGNDHTSDMDQSLSLSSNVESLQGISSTVLSSSSSDSIRRPIATGLYSHPNDHIVVVNNASSTNILLDKDPTPSSSSSASALLVEKPGLITDIVINKLAQAIDSPSYRTLAFSALKLVGFLPWCVIVGGALILSPDHLEQIAFRTGYIDHLSGIRRYSYLAEYGFQHIVSFIAFIALGTWMAPSAGFLCIGGLLAQFSLCWHSFLVDHTVPLGEDDRQTVYLLATSTWLNGATVNIRKLGDSYYAKQVDEDSAAPDGTISKEISS